MRIDWSRIINDILRSDSSMTFEQIARRIGVSKSSAVRMRSFDIEPKYSTGIALINLWRKSINHPNASLPTLCNRRKNHV